MSKEKKDPTIEVTEDLVTITLPVLKPLKQSKSGKSMVIATTHGTITTKALVNDRVVWMGVNVFIKH
jgi:hypothetical protein